MSQILQGDHSGQGKMSDMHQSNPGTSTYNHVSTGGEYTPSGGYKTRIGKSFGEHAADYPAIVKGMETNPVLYDMVVDVMKSFDDFEDILCGMLDEYAAESIEVNKSVGEHVSRIGKEVVNTSNRMNNLQENTDMLKSMMSGGGGNILGNVGFISRGGGSEDSISPGMAFEAMHKSVQAGTLDATDIIRFETTGEVTEATRNVLGLE